MQPRAKSAHAKLHHAQKPGHTSTGLGRATEGANVATDFSNVFHVRFLQRKEKHFLHLSLHAASACLICRFTVTYTRQSTAKPMLVLTGQLHIENEDEDNDVTITTPRVTISPTGSEAFNASSSAVKCPRLTIPAAGEIICKVTVNRRGMRPLAGSIQARVQTAGAEQGSSQAFDSRAGRIDFTKAKIVTTGEFANVTLYFEQGDGLLKPTAVYGQQPGEDVRIGDSRSFNFSGLYGGLNATQCGKRFQVSLPRDSDLPGSYRQLVGGALHMCSCM
jgi:hypothetical protein